MDDAPIADRPAAGASADTKAIIRSIVGTGIGLATLLLMLAGLTIQQNANLNARFDDLNARFDDLSVNARFANLNARFANLNANVNARFDDLQEDIHELRALIIDAIKGADAAD